MPPKQTRRGWLLVATPDLSDPNFVRTVVLVLEHTDDGAVGLVLNRPSDTDLEDVLPAWAPRAAPPTVAFVGGPVERERVIALARVANAPADSVEVLPGVATLDLSEPGRTGDGVAAVRLFAGYAGWAAGQLDDELASGGWFVAAAQADDAFAPEPDGLWREVLRRQPGRVAWFAHCPLDPSTN